MATLSDIINGTGVRYYARFADKKNVVNYLVVIKQSGYVASSSLIPELAGEDPLILKHSAQEDSKVKGSEIIFNIISRKNDFGEYDELTQGDDFEFELLIYDEVQFNFPIWQGYISPGESSRSYFENLSVLSIVATDYLAKLKDIDFSDPSGAFPRDRVKVIDVIGWVFAKLPGFIGLYAQSGFIEANMTTGLSIAQAWIYPKIFAKLKNGLVVGDTCYDVLNYIGKTFDIIFSSPLVKAGDIPSTGKPRFFITTGEDYSAPVYWVAYSTGAMTVGAIQSISTSINIDAYTFSRDSEFSRKIPDKALTLIQHNFDFGELFTEDNFSDLSDTLIWQKNNISGFSASGGIYSASVLANTYGTFRSVNGYQLTNPENNRYFKIAFTIKNTKAWVDYGAQLLNFTNNNLFIKVRIIEVTGTTIINKDEILLPLWPGQTLQYISPINANFEINPAYTYFFLLMVDNTTSTITKTFEFSEIEINTVYGNNGATLYNVMFDNLFEGVTQSGISSNKTLEIKLGDSDAERNASAITFSADDADITSAWKRYGKTETEAIQKLILQSYFNKFGGISRQLRINVYDPSNSIVIYKFIDFDGNKYTIEDIDRNFKSGWVSLRLQKIQTSDVLITVYKKFSVQATGNGSGNSSSSAGGGSIVIGGAGGGVTSHAQLTGLTNDDHPQYRKKLETTLTVANDEVSLDNGVDYTVDASGGSFTVYLPVPVQGAKIRLYFDFVDATHTITVNGDGENIEGSASLVFGAVYNKRLFEIAWNDTDEVWNLFGFIVGSGTANYLAKLTGVGALGNSLIYDNGTKIGINNNTPRTLFDIRNQGNLAFKFEDSQLLLSFASNTDNTSFSAISLPTSTSNNYGWSLRAGRTTSGQGHFYLNFHNNSLLGTNVLTALASGNIGLGKDLPAAKLDVEGMIFTKLGIGTEIFYSGFGGSGWEIDDENNATFDNLTVRKGMRIYELEINKIRSGNGSYWFSDGAKVLTVNYKSSTYWEFIFDAETGNPFMPNDIILCQVWTGSNIKYYKLRASATETAPYHTSTSQYFVSSSYDGTGYADMPEAGDEIVRIGSTGNASRRGAVYITSNDDDAPYIDVVNGLSTVGGAFTVKVRLGKLDGITNTNAGLSGSQTDYYGLYSDNVHLKGHIYSQSGEIGGWTLGASSLKSTNSHAMIHDTYGFAVSLNSLTEANILSIGSRVNMYYQDASNWGLKGVNSSLATVFQLGSTNKIGNFIFDNDKLYSNTLTLYGSDGDIMMKEYFGQLPELYFKDSSDATVLRIAGLNSSYSLIESTGGLVISETGNNTLQIQSEGGLIIKTLSSNDITILSDDNVNLTGDIINLTGEVYSMTIYNSTYGLSANMVVDSAGHIRRSTSSRKVKENINYKGVDPKLALKIKPVSFDIIENKIHQIGFIAEDLLEIDERFISEIDADIIGLNINAIVSALTSTVQAQQKQIDEQNEIIKYLTNIK